jgi:hypothetical protein
LGTELAGVYKFPLMEPMLAPTVLWVRPRELLSLREKCGKQLSQEPGVLPSRKPNPARGWPGDPVAVAEEWTVMGRGRLERPRMRPNSEGSAGASAGELRLSQSGSKR